MTNVRARGFALWGALAASACGAATGDEASDSIDDESEALTTGSYTFHCREAYQRNAPEFGTIRLSRTRAKLVVADPNLAGVSGTYTYNPNYKPRAASHQGDSQYAWDDSQGHKMVLLFESSMRTGGAALTAGGHGGDVTLEGPRISRAMLSLFCKR